MKYSYTPRNKSNKNAKKTIKINIDRKDVRDKVRQRKNLKARILEILRIRPYLRKGFCSNLDNPDRVDAATNIAMDHWESQIAAIDNLN